MKDPETLRVFPDGNVLRDYDPIESYEDGETNYSLRQRVRGITLATAANNAMNRESNVMKLSHYHECIPCLRCSSCVIVREIEHGEMRNRIYVCMKNRMKVDRYGTCELATVSRNGPLVIDRDVTAEELAAQRENLIN